MTAKKSAVEKAYEARKAIEEEGVECQLMAGWVALKAATGRNKEFVRMTKGIASGQKINDDAAFEQLAKTVARTVVTGWDSKAFGAEYSPDAFIEKCNALRKCGFLEDVLEFALDKEMFNAVAVAQAAKN